MGVMNSSPKFDHEREDERREAEDEKGGPETAIQR
jgi:hypothetical protein